jgi:hypothetical protein
MGSRDLRRAEWRKSSYSGANGSCVEVAAEWRKSTHSSANGSCVEVASNLPGAVAVRDSKDREGPKLAISDQAWSAFIQGIKRGEFGL